MAKVFFCVFFFSIALISSHLSAFHLHSSSSWLDVFMYKMKEYLIYNVLLTFKVDLYAKKNWTEKAKHPTNG